MIHVRAHAPAITGAGPVLEISLVGSVNILKFQAALARCLNTAPDFGPDWFELSDRVDQFILEHSITPTVRQSSKP